MQMNYKKNGEFEKLYPKTLAGNVLFNNGQTIEEYKKEIDDTINKKEDTFQELWSGNDAMGDGVSINPSKKLSECQNGWVFVFKNQHSSTNISYHYVPKVHIKLSNNSSSNGLKIIAGGSSGVLTHKYLLVGDGTIKGHSSNVLDGNDKTALYKILEY